MKYAALALSVLVFAGSISVSGLNASYEDMELGGKRIRGPVDFPHELHMEGFDCLDCHHVMENGENVLDASDLEEGDPDVLCVSCHDNGSKIEKREAFHYQCMGCHNDPDQAAGENRGPALCGECHLKKRLS